MYSLRLADQRLRDYTTGCGASSVQEVLRDQTRALSLDIIDAYFAMGRGLIPVVIGYVRDVVIPDTVKVVTEERSRSAYRLCCSIIPFSSITTGGIVNSRDMRMNKVKLGSMDEKSSMATCTSRRFRNIVNLKDATKAVQ